MSDVSPKHYQFAGVQTIDYIRAVLGPAGAEAYCVGNVIKYVSRYRHKGGLTDLKKAQVYLSWAVESLERKDALIEDALASVGDQFDPIEAFEAVLERLNGAEEPPLRAGGTD